MKNKLLIGLLAKTEDPKIWHFLVAVVVAAVLAILVDLVFYLIVGPTTLGTWYNKYRIAMFIGVFFIAMSCFLLRKKMAKSPEYLYLIIILVVGLLFAFSFTPKNVSWDQGVHYHNVYTWHIMSEEYEVSAADDAMMHTASIVGVDIERLSVAHLQDVESQLDAMDETIIKTEYYDKNYQNLYMSLPYLPSASVMIICDLLGLSFSLTYFLCILPYLFIYALVSFLGMRKLVSGKLLYGIIGLFPTVLFLASNYSYDAWAIAFSMYGFATLVAQLQQPNKPMTLKTTLLMLGAFVIGFAPKVIYAPLILLCLLVPKSKFKQARYSKLFRVGVIATALLVFATYFLPFLLAVPSTGDLRMTVTSPSEQIAFIFANPLEYARNFFALLFVGGEIPTGYYSLEGFPSYSVDYAYYGLPEADFWVVILVLLIFAFFADIGKGDSKVVSAKSRVLAVVLFFIVTLLIATALYISYNAVGNDVINGVQFRYLLPMIYCLLVFIRPSRAWLVLRGVKPALLNGSVLVMMTIVLLGSFWDVYARYLV